MSIIGQYLNTIGIEVEGVGMDKNTMNSLVVSNLQNRGISTRFSMFRDASTEWQAQRLRVGDKIVLVSAHTELSERLQGQRAADNLVMGYEIITHALEIPEMEALMYPLLYVLQSSGDYLSYRSSIHFHVGFAHHLRYMKNMLRICLAIDPVLYRLGGMGGRNRGFINNFAYARPLMNSLAAASYNPRESTRSRSKYVQVINPIAALNSSSIQQWWAAFGYTEEMGECKTHPSRYHGSNFYSIRKHGTMEFRHFNSSFNPNLVMAIAKYLRAMVELATTIGKNEILDLPISECNVEISTEDGSRILNTIFDMAASKDVDNLPTDFDMSILHEYLAMSSCDSILETPVLCHNADVLIPQDIAEMGSLKIFPKVLPACNIDIHNIRLLSIIKEGEKDV